MNHHARFTTQPALYFILLIFLSTCKHKASEEFVPPVFIHDTTPVTPPNLIDSICYQQYIEPLLVTNCGKHGCHNDTTHLKGINVSSYDATIRTLSGKLLLQCVQDSGSLGMPPDPYRKLDSTQVSLLKRWVSEGMKNNIDCAGPCDTSNVSYKNTLIPLLNNSCNGCHTNTQPRLVLYDSVRVLAINSRLMGSITHAVNYKAMPQNSPALSPCNISLFRTWIRNGAPNN